MGYLIIAIMVMCTLFVLIALRMAQNNIIRHIDSVTLNKIDLKPDIDLKDIDKSLRNEKGFLSYKKYVG